MRGRLHHIGIRAAYRGRRVVMLVAALEVRILSLDDVQLRKLKLDPTKDYQAIRRTSRCLRCLATPVSDVSRHHTARSEGFEPPTF